MKALLGILIIAGWTALLSPASALAASEISCGVFTAGGGRVAGSQIEIIGSLGQDVVGISQAAGHVLRHDVWPFRHTAVSAVGDQGLDIPGQTLRLLPNAPNPFNPLTEIRFEIPPGTGHVELRVYNATGRVVRTLIDGALSPGRHSTRWRGVDDRGTDQASGVYYAVLRAGGRRLIRKMTLLK